MDALPPGSLSLPDPRPLSGFGYPARRAEIQSQRVNGSTSGERVMSISDILYSMIAVEQFSFPRDSLLAGEIKEVLNVALSRNLGGACRYLCYLMQEAKLNVTSPSTRNQSTCLPVETGKVYTYTHLKGLYHRCRPLLLPYQIARLCSSDIAYTSTRISPSPTSRNRETRVKPPPPPRALHDTAKRAGIMVHNHMAKERCFHPQKPWHSTKIGVDCYGMARRHGNP
ncbi:hypothetical protein TEQG_08158 [Trichophyton equinum CBS 127.97]|uniref:Uncharacterized protein n=1 Tax=Trichophyton equinum (strain ATCC MYA-4606 / CBS 127.97) TaxID=559882 RepID=F2Q4M4_TRIEC|nr:hypothetical protein TEQG_08158 [Trichophyton equinum CBS 127.97]